MIKLVRIYKSNRLQENITLEIHYPENFFDDKKCTYTIYGASFDIERDVYGVDELQCLWLAFLAAGSDLYESIEYKNGHINWEGDLDLGLPRHGAIDGS